VGNRNAVSSSRSVRVSFARKLEKSSLKHGIGWLGREDSNLRMAESKSDYFSFELKAHSEKIKKFERLSINGLSV